jgi:tetratricopeptide (TPR) repeat protein
VIRLDPTSAVGYYHRGLFRTIKREYDAAIADQDIAISLIAQGKTDPLQPRPGMVNLARGLAHRLKQDYVKANADLRETVRLAPEDTDALRNLAWFMATTPRDDLRDGKTAIQYGKKTCELSGWKNADHLGTLAAAFAESGDFQEAVKWQKKALEAGYVDKEELDQAQMRLKLYEAGKPYRDQ